MTALLYRGHSYEAPTDSPKACIELTYRRETYNTCREEVARNAHPTLTYRGASYAKRSRLNQKIPSPCLRRGFLFAYELAPTRHKGMGWAPEAG